jgi:Mg/Co/Ni transporter MgtE
VSGAPTRVFIARLAGTPLFDPMGDQVGRVRDVVVTLRVGREEPRVLGLVVEVPGRRRIFVPMTRVTSIDAGQVITTGLVNMRRFQQRPTETLALGEMLDRTVTLLEDGTAALVEDVGMEQQRTRDWTVTRLFVRKPGKGLRRRGEALTVAGQDAPGYALEEVGQGAATPRATFARLNAADLATVLHEISPKRRVEVAAALDDEKLADGREGLTAADHVGERSKHPGGRAAPLRRAQPPRDAPDHRTGRATARPPHQREL